MQKTILKRASSNNKVECIKELNEDQTLLRRKVDIISDDMAKTMLKHGDWIKEEVEFPDGSSYIQLVKTLMPITPGWLSGERPNTRKNWWKSRH